MLFPPAVCAGTERRSLLSIERDCARVNRSLLSVDDAEYNSCANVEWQVNLVRRKAFFDDIRRIDTLGDWKEAAVSHTSREYTNPRHHSHVHYAGVVWVPIPASY